MLNDSEEHASAVAKLKTYITQNEGAIVMAGPPTLKASLSNFYKREQAASSLIKTYESGDNKVGIHSFVVDHSSIFKIVGKGNDKSICLVNAKAKLKHGSQTNDKHKALAEIKVCIHSMQVMLAQLSERVDRLAIA